MRNANNTEQAQQGSAAERRKVLSNQSGQETFGIPRFAYYIALALLVAPGFFLVPTFPGLEIPLRILGVVLAAATLGLAYTTRSGLPVSERFERIVDHHTRRYSMLNIRNGSTREQPDEMNILGRIARLSALQNAKYFGRDPEDDRPQASVHVKRPFHNSPAIETEDGSVIGAIRVTPASMAVADEGTWEQRVSRLAEVIDTAVKHKTEFTSRMRAVDYSHRVDEYETAEREAITKLRNKHGSIEAAYSKVGETMEESDIDREDLRWMLEADLAAERQDVLDLYDATTMKRDYFVTIKIEPKDVVLPEHVDSDSGGLHTLPFGLGELWKDYKVRQLRKTGDHTAAMVERLEVALNTFEEELRTVQGITPQQISSTEFSQAISDHFHAANIYATADYEDIIRSSPKPEASDESIYGVSYDHLQSLPDEPLGGPSPDAPSAGTKPVSTDGGEGDDFFEQVQEINGHPVADIVTTEEELVEHYQSKMAPYRVDTESNEWIVIENATYSTTFSVRDWPAVPKMGILEPIIDAKEPGVAVNMANHITPEDQHEAEKEIDAAEKKARDNVEKATGENAEQWSLQSLRAKLDTFTNKYQKQHQQATEMKEANLESEYDLFKSNTHIELRSDDPQALRDTVTELSNTLKKDGARMEPEDYYNLEGYESVAPVCNDKLEEPIRMFADGIARQFMWTSGNLDEANGVEFGTNLHTGEKLYLDFLNRRNGYDFGIFGPKGSGKTTTASKILKGLREKYGDDIFIGLIDPLREYPNLSILSGGTHVVVGGPVGMNPYNLVPTPEDKIGLLEDSPYSQWDRKAMDFIELYYADIGIDLSGKRGIWQKANRLAAEKYGITPDPHTHHPENRVERQREYFGIVNDLDEATLRDQDWHEEFDPSVEQRAAIKILESELPEDVPSIEVNPRHSPTPLTAVHIIDEMAEDGTPFVRSPSGEPSEEKVKEREQKAIDIANNDVEPFLDDGEYSHFCRQNEIDFENAATVYADLAHRENNSSIGLSMMVLYDLMYDHIKSIDKPGVIFTDEHHKMLRDDLVQESMNMKIRSGRHFDLINGVSTQSFKDYFGGEDSLTDTAETLFDNMPTRIYQQDYITREWLEDLSLSQEEADFIGECEPGDEHLGFSTALLWVKDKGSYPLQVKMDRHGRDPENPREAIFIDYDIESHGADMLEYLLENNDNAQWRFAPEAQSPTPAAPGVGR